jgi:membrane protease YdiL (CAAX protease family)
MKILAIMERIQRERPGMGWLLTVLGVIMPVIASLGACFLFALAGFSSNVRDTYEKPPGVLDYFLFGLALAMCACLFLTGILLIWARVRRCIAA